ncbi:uncharacterized protein B0H64DRAFT_100598 [Chaetomium fimeti]|uniref:Cell wall mannoprotein PIR1-like C-terminal domain-containing protein n=1 Tax=Chaetomium fimeti TaxID=1854472 RepID=A0AAE0HMX0_9PEZI|nr:hypothetical protein B0H64DRAFT_100598 [Chaetomium fimeti]
MKPLAVLAATAALAPHSALARWLSRANTTPGCAFTLSSSGSFVCPAGQLEDGQIRLNGSYPTATFYLDPDGGITDSDGYGCIVTGSPTTQIQCDQGKSPTSAFSIDASKNLLYQGSPDFWACPATDTEYNIYVDPEFGQTKCFPIGLKASSCGPAAPTCTPPSTVWETQTQTVTVIVTNSQTCSAGQTSTTSTSLDTVCRHCTGTKSLMSSSESGNFTILPTSTETRTPINPSDSEIFTILPISTDGAGTKRSPSPEHVKRAPGEGVLSGGSHHRLSRRDLYEDWNAVRETTRSGARETAELKWVRTGRVREFPLQPGQSLKIGTDYFYGCTVFVVVGSQRIIFGHIAQIGPTGCVEFEERDETQYEIIPRITSFLTEAGTSLADVSPPTCPTERFAWIMGTVADDDQGWDRGPAALKEWMVAEGIPPANLHYNQYKGGSGEIDGPPGGIFGKALVTVTPEAGPGAGQQRSILRVYMTSEEPRIELTFNNQNGQLVLDPIMNVAISSLTTDGNKQYTNNPTE